jgi:ligand-binding SRPBCC domain-containing protein
VGKLVAEHWVNADLRQVFAFFSDPHNLPRLMPKQMNVRLEELTLVPPVPQLEKAVVESGPNSEAVVGSGGPTTKIAGRGSQIVISFRLVPFLPFRGRWVAEILEYEPLSHFVDEQRSGPMRSWRHRHSFQSEVRNGTEGTIVRDEVEYELPFGILGRIADWLFIERMMRRTFAARQSQLGSLFPPEV